LLKKIEAIKLKIMQRVFKNDYSLELKKDFIKPRVLCLDVGSFKTGVAVSSSCLRFASPLGLIKTDFDLIAKCFAANNCKTLVVGYPFIAAEAGNKNTKENPELKICNIIDSIVDIFSKTYIDVNIFYVNENFSSEIVQSLHCIKKNGKLKNKLDSSVACFLLQNFLD